MTPSSVVSAAPTMAMLPGFTRGVDFVGPLAFVGLSVATPWYFYVRSDLPVTSLKDLVAYSKANPGKLNFGSPSVSNLAFMGILESRTGITTTKVPYNGPAPVATAMLAGDAQSACRSACTPCAAAMSCPVAACSRR